MILYRRSHFVPTARYAELEESIRTWRATYSDSLPGFSEIIRAFVIDDPTRGFITLESTSADGFRDGGCPALEAITERVLAIGDGEVRYYDNYDVVEHVAPGADERGTPLGSLYRSTWFTSDSAAVITQQITRWQETTACDLDGYARSWLIRGISDPSVHALSVEWVGEHALRTVAPPATDALFDQIASAMTGTPETFNVRSGGDLTETATDA